MIRPFLGWHPIPLGFLHGNPYKAVKSIGIDAMLLADASGYDCPYLEYVHHSVVPMHMFTHDPAQYQTLAQHLHKDMLFDIGYMRNL